MKNLKLAIRFLLIGVALLLAVLIVKNTAMAQSPSDPTADDEIMELTSENLENFLDEFVPAEMEEAHVPGLVITVVSGDEVLLSKGYGYANIQHKIPMTPYANVRAGSVSKSVLATGVIKLVEQGVLDLNAPVSDYITDLELADEFGPAATIGQLLTHMSGYPDTLVESHSPDLAGYDPLGEVLRTDLVPRAFAPGTVSAYSDWNFSLLGYAIEKATGSPYEIVLADLLFAPLGMENTTYLQPLPEAIYQDLATGYGWDYSKNQYYIVPHDFVRMSPGIALVTNGNDMGIYLRMLLNEGGFNGKQILDDQSLSLLLERQGGAHEYSRGWSYGFIENTISGRRVLYKDGNGMGFSNRVVLMPDQDLGIFISINHRNLGEGMWLTRAAGMATRTLPSAIFEKFVPETEVKSLELQPPYSDIDLDQFTGHYQKAGVSRDDFFKLEGMLDNVDVKTADGGNLKIGSSVYQPVAPLVFQHLENPDFHIIFAENQENEVEFLTFGGTGSYQKVPWYQARNFQIGLLVVITLISIVMVIAWPFTRQGHWMGWVVGLFNLAFIAGVAWIFNSQFVDLLDFFKTIPLWLDILFIVPWMIGISAISLPFFLVQMWKAADVSWYGRIQYLLMTASAFTIFWLANLWNLIH